MKSQCWGPALCTGVPDEFGDMLTYSRSLELNQIPDYVKLRGIFSDLADKVEGSLDGPFDWTACYPKTTNPLAGEPEILPAIPKSNDEGNYGDNALGTTMS